jgi:dolichol-phosphate mannosyltransferase
MLSAAAVAEVMALPERGRVYRLLIPAMGFRSAVVEYAREPRVAGQSKYPVRRMVRLAADSYFSFTVAPLRFATWAGALGFVLCVGFAVLAVVAYQTGRTVPGWASFALVLGFVGAVQFLFLGLIGEYLARIYLELQARPRYYLDHVRTNAGAPAEVAQREVR